MAPERLLDVDGYFSPFVLVDTVVGTDGLDPRSVVNVHYDTKWSLRTTRWSTSLPQAAVERTLETRYHENGDQDTGEACQWTGTGRNFGVPFDVHFTRDGDIIVDRYLPGFARFAILVVLTLCVSLFALSPDAAVSALGIFGAALVVFLPTSTPKPITDRNSRCTARRTTAVSGAGLLVAAVMIWIALDITPADPLLMGVFVAVLLIQLTTMYLENALPGLDTAIGETTLYIPLFGITQTLLAAVLFFVVQAFFSGWYVVADAWVELLASGFTITKASLYADLTGHTLLPSDQVNRELLMTGFFTATRENIQLLFQLVFGWILLSILSAWGIRRTLRRTRLTRVDSYGRYLILGGTVISNIGIFAAVVIAVDILLFGILGRSFLDPSLYTAVVTAYVQQDGLTGEVFLHGIYRSFEYTFQGIPVVPPRLIGVLVTGTLLWPFVLIASNTVSAAFLRPVRQWLLVWRSSPLREYGRSVELEDDIRSRVVTRDGVVDVRPLPLLLGRRKYILVTEAVVDELSDGQLEAILRHEEYHLQNRERSFVAMVLSLAVGGQNAILAFYDYPQMELNADRHAAERVGKPNLKQAIRRMDNLKSRTRLSNGATLGLTHPGFIGPASESDDVEELWNTVKALRTVDRKRLWIQLTTLYRSAESVVSAFEDILFGATLYNAAHFTPDERIRHLDQLEIREE